MDKKLPGTTLTVYVKLLSEQVARLHLKYLENKVLFIDILVRVIV